MSKSDREKLYILKNQLEGSLTELGYYSSVLFLHTAIFMDLDATYLHVVHAGNSVCKININGSGYNVTFTSEFSDKDHESTFWFPGYRSILSSIKTAILRYEYEKGQKNMNDNIYMMSGRCNGKTQYILNQLKKSCNTIKDVIFNDPATIVFWTDGSKTVVKCQNGETFDPEKGLAMAISKKMFGNNYGYYEMFAKYVGRYNKKRFNKALEEAKKIPPDEIVHNGVVYRRVEDNGS